MSHAAMNFHDAANNKSPPNMRRPKFGRSRASTPQNAFTYSVQIANSLSSATRFAAESPIGFCSTKALTRPGRADVWRLWFRQATRIPTRNK